MNNAMLAADISDRIPELALESKENRFNLVLGLIILEQQRRPVIPAETLTPEQKFELTCLRDHLTRAVNSERVRRLSTAIGMRPGSPVSDYERDCDHWLSVLNQILKTS